MGRAAMLRSPFSHETYPSLSSDSGIRELESRGDEALGKDTAFTERTERTPCLKERVDAVRMEYMIAGQMANGSGIYHVIVEAYGAASGLCW